MHCKWYLDSHIRKKLLRQLSTTVTAPVWRNINLNHKILPPFRNLCDRKLGIWLTTVPSNYTGLLHIQWQASMKGNVLCRRLKAVDVLRSFFHLLALKGYSSAILTTKRPFYSGAEGGIYHLMSRRMQTVYAIALPEEIIKRTLRNTCRDFVNYKGALRLGTNVRSGWCVRRESRLASTHYV
jgi:hypothetical protein